ncbi:MAG: type I-E CRISPR-associated endoribonuclease Cas2 [Burkholderiales bacterium]|nr:MAG: type I-E CRISPR-associated endoribonuclease Cas2 [Burkholderiales bacterium]
MWIVIALNKPRPALRGYCRRFLLEPQSNLFVGNATKPLVLDLIARIESMRADAVLIYGHRGSDLGLGIKIFGRCDRQPTDFDGLQLILRKSKG